MVIQALRYHFISRPEVKILLIVVNVFAVIAATLFFLKKVSAVAFLLSSLLWMLLMVAFWNILPNTVYKKAETFKQSFRLIFGEAGIKLETERGFTEWEWKNFSTWFESPNFIHLYFDSRSFFLIPKYAFLDEDAIITFRKLLKEKIVKK